MPATPILSHARLADSEWSACAHLAGGRRAPLSPLPPAGAAPEAGSPVWERLEAGGVLTRDATPIFAPPWQAAFRVLASARSRCRLALGTPEWVEQTGFYAAGPWQGGSLVTFAPAGGGGSVGFPVSRRDVGDLVFSHLGFEVQPRPSGFRQRFSATEFAVLLAAASQAPPAPSFTPHILFEACARSCDGPVPPVRWAGVAPWGLELDESAMASGLASLRARGLALTGDELHYAGAPALAELLGALRGMERYAAVDFVAELPGGAMRSVRFLIFVSRCSWWMLDFGGDRRQGATAESVVPQQVELALARLARLTFVFRKEETMNDDGSTTRGAVRSYELTEEELLVLVQATGHRLAAGSPVAGLRSRSATLEQRAVQTLAQRGLLDGNRPEPVLARAVAALAQPAFEVAEIGGFLPRLAGSHAYASADPGGSFAVGYRNDGPERHVLRFPLSDEEMFPVAQALLRSGRAGSVAPFRAVMAEDEFAVLLALVDVYRRAVLTAAMERRVGPPVRVTADAVGDMFHRGVEGADCRWLVTLVRELSLQRLELPVSEIPAVLARLAQRGFLTPVDGGYRMSADCAAFCHCLSAAEAAVGVALATRRREGGLPPAGCMAFWAGGMLWLVDSSKDDHGRRQLQLGTVLPLELRLVLRAALEGARNRAGKTPPAITSAPPPVPPAPAVAQRCAACGAPLRPGTAFCTRCGAPRAKATSS